MLGSSGFNAPSISPRLNAAYASRRALIMIFDSEGLLIRASFWPQRTAPGHKLAAKIRFRIEGRFFISTVKGESHLISELPPARGGEGREVNPVSWDCSVPRRVGMAAQGLVSHYLRFVD